MRKVWITTVANCTKELVSTGGTKFCVFWLLAKQTNQNILMCPLMLQLKCKITLSCMHTFTRQDQTSDTEVESSVAFSDASCYSETGSMMGASSVSGIFVGSFYINMITLLDYSAYGFQRLQDTPVMGDLQCVRALWTPNATLDRKTGRTWWPCPEH